ncbi:TPA: hypothetical protein ACOEOA_000129, partial [Stenotrophomonas maltophilia]
WPVAGGRWAVDPRHMWINLHGNRIFRELIEQQPSKARLYRNAGRSQESVEGGVGPVAGV